MKTSTHEKRIRYRWCTASAAQLLDHLTCCSDHYDPPLAQRVNLHRYAEKLFHRSCRFEAWDGDVLVGLVAAYLDRDAQAGRGFITNVSVLPEYRSRGIANKLLAQCRDDASARGLRKMELEVSARSHQAVALYTKLGFSVIRSPSETLSMVLHLGVDS